MKTSARNPFRGHVSAIQSAPINAEVDVDMNGKGRIVAAITHESVENLNRKGDAEAWPRVKAPWTIVTPDDPGIRLSNRNRLCGIVAKPITGAVNSEVQIKLESRDLVTAMFTNDSATGLELAKGSRACAAFKASSVIVGVSA